MKYTHGKANLDLKENGTSNTNSRAFYHIECEIYYKITCENTPTFEHTVNINALTRTL